MEINDCKLVLFTKNGFPYFPFVDPCYKTIAFNCGPHKLTRMLHLCRFNAEAKRKMKGAKTNFWARIIRVFRTRHTPTNQTIRKTLDEEKNGHVARDQLLYALSAVLMPGVPDKASTRGHVGIKRTAHQGYRFDCCLCEAIFTRKKSLKSHLKSRHLGHGPSPEKSLENRFRGDFLWAT